MGCQLGCRSRFLITKPPAAILLTKAPRRSLAAGYQPEYVFKHALTGASIRSHFVGEAPSCLPAQSAS
jgi:hypothetical protein